MRTRIEENRVSARNGRYVSDLPGLRGRTYATRAAALAAERRERAK